MAQPARPAPLAVPIGHRIRALRQKRGLAQVALAAAVEISPSYLNLIEHNHRTIGGALLMRIAAALGTTGDQLTGREEARVAAELQEMAADPVLALPPMGNDVPRLVGESPDLARMAVAAYRAYQEARTHGEALAEGLAQDPFLAKASHQVLTLITAIRSFSEILEDYGDMEDAQRRRFVGGIAEESRRLTDLSGKMFDFLGNHAARRPQLTPEEEVDDLFHDHGNHFPTLEATAAAVRSALPSGDSGLFGALVEWLERRHDVTVKLVDPDTALGGADHAYDPGARLLRLSEALPPSSWRFRVAHLMGRLDAADAIEALIDTATLSTNVARARARHALANAYAGALLLPHDQFLLTAKTLRYDIERLQERFTAGFEQICHRLASLSPSPKAQGEAQGEAPQEGAPIPFHFLRTDIAGNISKRFSASGLRLPRHTGACPRWSVHTAFLTPGRIVTQVARLPDDSTYLFITQAVTRPGGGWRAPRTHHSVMIGCDIAFARRMVYGDALDPAAPGVAEPVGISCRQCPRSDCRQRAAPQLRGSGVRLEG